jgi:hypothetical protein
MVLFFSHVHFVISRGILVNPFKTMKHLSKRTPRGNHAASRSSKPRKALTRESSSLDASACLNAHIGMFDIMKSASVLHPPNVHGIHTSFQH